MLGNEPDSPSFGELMEEDEQNPPAALHPTLVDSLWNGAAAGALAQGALDRCGPLP